MSLKQEPRLENGKVAQMGCRKCETECTSSAKHILQISAVVSDAKSKNQKHSYRRKWRAIQKASEQTKHVEVTHNIKNKDAVTISKTCVGDKSKCLEGIAEKPKLDDDHDQSKVIMSEVDKDNENVNKITLDLSLTSLICLITYLLLHNAIILIYIFVIVARVIYLAGVNSMSISETMLGKVMKDVCRTKMLVTILVREECVPIRHDLRSMQPELYNSACKKISKLGRNVTYRFRKK